MDAKSKRMNGRRALGGIADIFFSPTYGETPRVGETGETVAPRGATGRRAVARLMIFCALAFLLARAHAVWSAYPFGLALICASNRFVPLGYAAICLGAASNGIGTPIYITFYTLAFLLRLFFSRPRSGGRFLPASHAFFCEPTALRISAATVSGFAFAVYELLAGGFAVASILYAASMLALTLLFCVAFLPFFESRVDPIEVALGSEHEIQSAVSPIWLEVSVASLLFALTLSLDGIEYFGISADYCLAALAALVVARRFGALRGSVAGLIASLGTGIASIAYMPAFALVGLAAGLLRRSGAVLSTFIGCAVGALLAIYASGARGLVELLPELVIAATLALPIMKLSRIGGEIRERSADPSESASTADAGGGSHGARLDQLSRTFSSLSEVFYGLSGALRRPELSGGARVRDSVSKKYCSSCSRAAECAAATGARLSETAERTVNGSAPCGVALAEAFPEDCPSLREAVAEAEAALEGCRENRRRSKSSELFGFEYDSVASLISEADEAARAEERLDMKLGIRLRDALRESGIAVDEVTVRGERHRRIVAEGVRWESHGGSAEELRRRFEEICGTRLTNPSWELDGERVRLELSSMPRLSAELFCLSRGREETDGDLICSFENQNGYFYALLSDGMGSGGDAAYASGLCGVFLEKLLTLGVSKANSLRMLNNLMRNKGSEASATVDLFELDLISGRACFVKSGAATSYVRRGSDLFRIRSKTVPIGILRSLDAEQTAFDIREGDRIIMLSDGVSQTAEESPWLIELLSRPLPHDPREIASMILARAREGSGEADDMTVGVICVEAASEESRGGTVASPVAGDERRNA